MRGWLRDGLSASSSVLDFGGLFVTDLDAVKLSFFIEWSFAGTESELITAFYGSLHQSEKSEVLKLEWLLSAKIDGLVEPVGIKDSCLLVDSVDDIGFALSPEYGTPFNMAHSQVAGRLRKVTTY